MCSGDHYILGNNVSHNRARAINHRQENDEAVGGFFSQIGDLYVVHHLWGEYVHMSCTQSCDAHNACDAFRGSQWESGL